MTAHHSGRRILFILNSLEMGGAERQALMFARYLQNTFQADIHICGFGKADALTHHMLAQGLHLFRITNPLEKGIWKAPARFLAVARQIRAVKPEVILPYTNLPNVVAGIIWKCTSARLCVWNQRDAGLFNIPLWALKLASTLTPCFMANSSAGTTFLRDALHVAPHTISRFPNAVSLPPAVHDRHTWRIRLNVSPHQIVSVMVANLSHQKDHETLLRALHRVLRNYANSDLHKPILVLAGRSDSTGQKLEQLAEQLGIRKQVCFMGMVDDITGLLQAADIAVFSSRSEGCPNGILEAMSVGLPILATHIPGTEEIAVDSGICLVHPGDPEDMARAWTWMLSDTAQRARFGKRNKQLIQDRFSPTTVFPVMAARLFEWVDQRCGYGMV